MGRYDKIRYWNGSAWVQPSQMKVWNGSAWVDYGANNSDNTKALRAWNGSGWQRFTRNKKVTNTSTLNYKYIRSPIDGPRNFNFNNTKSISGAYRFCRHFSGYVCINPTTDDCGVWGSWHYGTWNTGFSFDDMLHKYSTNHFQLRSRFNTSTIYYAYSCKSATRGEWHWINFNSLYCYNKSTAYSARSIMQIDSGGAYWMKTGSTGGGSAQGSAGLYLQFNCYTRLGGTDTYYKGPIKFGGVNYNSSIVYATVNVDTATVGSKISTSSIVTWTSTNTVQGNYTNTSTTTWE